MHQIKSSGSPYIAKITLDVKRKISAADIMCFQRQVRQGVAVYGHTPDIMILTTAAYLHWDTLALLAAAMDTGRLAICTDDKISDFVERLSTQFTGIRVRLFSKKEQSDCQRWLVSGGEL